MTPANNLTYFYFFAGRLRHWKIEEISEETLMVQKTNTKAPGSMEKEVKRKEKPS
ncbi:hypothetical protein [Methanosarcina barkeri]|uniref:hypothetical protein n=1 Tax=Methanosarcina barkeri TaxID=2208 RepID=UPI000A57CD17|nr:hypothetical protein [Methanosarcina barkeri]